MLAPDTTGAVTAWPTTATAEQPTVDRRHYVGKHRAGKHHDRHGRGEIDQPVGADYSPLTGLTRTGLAPHHYQRPDVYVHADPAELTGRLDPVEVLAEQAGVEAGTTRADVMAEMRAGLTDPAAERVRQDFAAAGCTTNPTDQPNGADQ